MSAQSDHFYKPTVAIETHGCKLNQADSAVLASDFVRAGFRLVDDRQPADVYLVNTCTVTHVADRKARHSLRAARRRNPEATVVASGCYAQRSPEALRGLAEVDLVVGNTERAALVRRVLQLKRRNLPLAANGAEVQPLGQDSTRTRAMIKIQEGCDQVCAYCIVPKVRGRERSVPAEELVERIDGYVSRGYKEVVLTGTQLGTYGFDLPGIDLTGLLNRILTETAVARVRVSSLQPQEIDVRLLSLWSEPRLCPHFHIALQSGSDAVLRSMRRRYTAGRYAEAVQMVRQAVPGASITTDVIVGFPGETDKHFQQTYALCDLLGFAAMHVFPFSVRPGTSAAYLSEAVGVETRTQRVQELLSLSRRHAAAFREGLLGTTRQVLWEGRSEPMGPDMWAGLTDNYVRVVAPSARSLGNRLTPALLHAREKDLVLAQVL